MKPEARAVIAPWTKFVTEGLPYVSLKLALSLDGRIATRSGASKWVTGPEARALVHMLRARHDAVAIGIGTALADDPRLTVRDASGVSPTRVVFDTKLRLPTHSRLVETAVDVPTWVILQRRRPDGRRAGPDGARGRGAPGRELRRGAARCRGGLPCARHEGGRYPDGGRRSRAGREHPGRPVGDELHAFIAPILLGPRGRPGAVDWAGPATPAEAPRISAATWELCGSDAYVRGPLQYPGSTA